MRLKIFPATLKDIVIISFFQMANILNQMKAAGKCLNVMILLQIPGFTNDHSLILKSQIIYCISFQFNLKLFVECYLYFHHMVVPVTTHIHNW